MNTHITRTLLLHAFGLALILLIPSSLAAQTVTTPSAKPPRDPYKDIYRDYSPPFLQAIERGNNLQSLYRGFRRDAEEMKLSTEPLFYTQNIVEEDSRATALIDAGLAKEQDGQFREALKIYQQVIDKYPTVLYRVAASGVFVPASQYCQRRILGFPAEDLAFYRTLYDPRAKEAFEQAKRQYSLLGLSDIVTQMLATTYGGPALVELGNAALDAGYYLAALEYFSTVRDFFPDKQLHSPELSLKIAYCEKMLGAGTASPPAGDRRDHAPRDESHHAERDAYDGRSSLTPQQLASFELAVAQSKASPAPFHSQFASEPHTTSDDYTLLPPTTDPLATQPPTWEQPLPGSRHDYFVYTQPTVAGDSIVYRHKNLVYCRSVLNGEPRWSFEVGGRASWQNWSERIYPQDDVLVQDGLVFTTVSKSGPSLVALDLVTGQLRWAYGPMAAANEEEARMRFEAAPASGPRTVFAGYVLDNIEGETHTDTEYGLIAFDSKTGRINWRASLCRLTPGKFSGGYAETRRNRIRSFTSPPLYHEGTIYYNTNAGAVAALDALSGQVKWLMRYPYYPEVHDATRVFGRGGDLVQYTRIYFRPHQPMFWYNHRPLMVDERLIVGAVDTPMLMSLDRRTGRVQWITTKANNASAYLLGLTRQGLLAIAYTGRDKQIDGSSTTSPLHLLDPATGKTEWTSPDVVKLDDQPVMKNYVFGSPAMHFRMNDEWFEMAARPLLTEDDKVYLPSFRYLGYPIYGTITNLGVIDLARREVIGRRRYYSGEILARADVDIHTNGPEELRAFEESPMKDDKIKQRIQMLKEVIADTVPENDAGPFLPFSRVTFQRYGVPFELRINARSLAMVYDQPAVATALASRQDPAADFARAELALADSRLEEASQLLQKCLATISSEDLDFRAAINQQLYRVFQGLAQRAIRAGHADEYLQSALGMSRTANSLAEEIETLFAAAEAYEQRGEHSSAAAALATIIGAYGQHEVPVSPVAFGDPQPVFAAAQGVIGRYQTLVDKTLFSQEMGGSLQLMNQGLALYQSVLSPAPKTLIVRAGELASRRLMKMQAASSEFAREWERRAAQELSGKPAEELLARAAEFPATKTAQQSLEQLLATAARHSPAAGSKAAALPDSERQGKGAAARQQLWRLNDLARFSGLTAPRQFQLRVSADVQHAPLAVPQTSREMDLEEDEGASRLVLQRQDELVTAPELLFVGSQLRKKLDNKFTVAAFDLTRGQRVWETAELRLKGKGQEPGFFEAFVLGDLVVVHGLYDVLALALKDGAVRWRYQAPFDFEIRHALLSGDMLILSGSTESLALFVPTDNPNGEVAWQVQEQGDLYIDPYTTADRLVSVRKLPFNVTVRYRATGRLMGRMELPDLSQFKAHPLLENGPAELPAARDHERLMLTDGWYYILIDVGRLAVVWKRLIDNNDTKREPALRFTLQGDYFLALKEDYDVKAMYAFSSRTGEMLWKSDPKDSKAPLPLHCTLIAGDKVFGIQPHAGQGFYFVGRDARTGQQFFREELATYKSKPQVRLLPHLFGQHVVAEISDGQDFELRAFDLQTGRNVATLPMPGVGPFGTHGHMSATVQHGRMVLMSKHKLGM